MTLMQLFESMEYGPAPESAAEARAWLSRHDEGFGHFIGGSFERPEGEERFPSLNPANGEQLAMLSQASAATVDAAVAAARKALPGWQKLSGHERARHLYALARLLQKHARLFAVLETLDNGKPIRESRDGDVPLAIRHFYHHAGWAQIADRELADHEPLGVVGQIIPWNFPLLMLAWKVAPALATGNTVVLKPAEQTSLTAMLFAEICVQAGLPAGVVNIVTGDGRTGEALVRHPDVAKIAFTGSTEVGRKIREALAGTGKALSLELGGKSPFIVFDDADLDAAVEGVVDAIWYNQGEVCCAGSRLLLQEPVAERFIARLERRMERLVVGDPLDKNTDIGALASEEQLARVSGFVEQARSAGIECFQAGEVPDAGCFFPPTLLTGVENADQVAQEEIFGPVLCVMTFRTPAEAVQLANNSRYGLAASVWSENIGLALDIAPQLKAGVVWINSHNQFDAAAPFGGVRESGFGREGGRAGLYEYLRPKAWKGLRRPTPQAPAEATVSTPADAAIDRTPKFWIGGKQVRPDSGYSRVVTDSRGRRLGEVGIGNRKDIRNAVEAAAKASGWAKAPAHLRAQILYYLAENLDARAEEFADRVRQQTGWRGERARAEVALSVERLFSYAAWCDKFHGETLAVPMRGLALAIHEPVGVMGLIAPPEAPMLGAVSLLAPAVAMGNRVVLVADEVAPLSALELCQVFETSDIPAGVINVLSGDQAELALALAGHAEVDALWHFGTRGIAEAEGAAAGNLKRFWGSQGCALDWRDREQAEGPLFLRQAVEVKTVWTPYGA